jgi:tRNA1(Val) A37 N6-methylase TrmN6
MSVSRFARDRKRQLGQFLTPDGTAAAIVGNLHVSPGSRILEPSFGEGAFLFQIMDSLKTEISESRLSSWCEAHLFGCEIDERAYKKASHAWQSRGLGRFPGTLEHCDFFTWLPPSCDRAYATDHRGYFKAPRAYFDLVIGNPPFGGSINAKIQDELDAIFGFRNRRKIKKETYSFFIVKSVDLLKPGGRLVFICSDTILTIATMTGLRSWLQSNCDIEVTKVPGTFSDTNQDMLLLTATKRETQPKHITIFDRRLPLADIETTPNMSWRVNGDLAKYFTGATVGDKLVATSGMTIGKNAVFLRRISNGRVLEPYTFCFTDRPITLDREIAQARLGKLSASQVQKIKNSEASGATERVVSWTPLAHPKEICLPHDDYRFYNKASSQIIYSEPNWVIFWRGDGEYVYNFKKTGNWYLHGVGGMKYFGREGLTWALIAPKLYMRYLPAGYILDSGAPCAFLRPGVEHDELFFILGWSLTDLCNTILKEVLNHTRNIQSKDFERLPYPAWVSARSKRTAVLAVKELLARSMKGEMFSFKSADVRELNAFYEWEGTLQIPAVKKKPAQRTFQF